MSDVIASTEWPVTLLSARNAAWDGFSASLVRARQDVPAAFAVRGRSHSLFFNLGPRPILMESRIEGGPARDGPLPGRAWTLIPAGMTLRGVNSHARPFDYLSVLINPAALAAVAPDGVPNLIARLGSLDETMIQSARKLRTALMTDGKIGRLYAAQIGAMMSVELMLGHATGRRRSESAAGGLSAHALKRVIDYLANDLSGEPDPAELVALSGVSRGHFFRAFRQSTGSSPERHRTALRVERAKALMAASPELGPASVAAAVGLGTTRRLRAAFLRVTGLNLTEFRRQT